MGGGLRKVIMRSYTFRVPGQVKRYLAICFNLSQTNEVVYYEGRYVKSYVLVYVPYTAVGLLA